MVTETLPIPNPKRNFVAEMIANCRFPIVVCRLGIVDE